MNARRAAVDIGVDVTERSWLIVPTAVAIGDPEMIEAACAFDEALETFLRVALRLWADTLDDNEEVAA